MKLISPNNKIVIFGSKGMVGSAILRKLKENGYSKFMSTRKDLDLTNYIQVKKWFENLNRK